jgi:hypothetical protein
MEDEILISVPVLLLKNGAIHDTCIHNTNTFGKHTNTLAVDSIA